MYSRCCRRPSTPATTTTRRRRLRSSLAEHLFFFIFISPPHPPQSPFSYWKIILISIKKVNDKLFALLFLPPSCHIKRIFAAKARQQLLPRRLHDVYLISLSYQQLSKAPELGAFFYAVCGFVNRFAVFVSHSFHFFSISSSSSFSSYCIYISCNFLRLDSEQFGNTHSHTSINCLAHTCVHNSEIAAQAILKRRVGRGGNTGRTNVLLLLGLWGWPEAALILIIKYQILLVVAPFGISVICTGSIYHMYICNYVSVCVCLSHMYIMLMW